MIQVEYAKQSNASGITLWSLGEDDAKGLCGVGSFPVLQNVWDLLHRSPSTFDDFADLDIVLSTGESQERLLLQDLETNPDEMKKLPCERVGFYRHPTDCTKFYHCSEYRTTKLNHTGPYAGFLYKCPEGLIYDERQESCIWPSMSDPCQGSGELLPVPAKKFSCVVPGFHVDPENCRWFYYCSDLGDGRLEAFEFLCPSDLLGYDEKQMLCNWKWTVPACINSEKQPETNSRNVASPVTIRRRKNISAQGRRAKALNVQEIHSPHRSQALPNVKPIKLNTEIGERSTIAEHEIYFAEINRDIPVREVSLSTYTESTGYLKDIPEKNDKKDVDILSNGKLTNENNSQHKKIGTAVWRRTNSGRDNRRIISIPDPFKDDFTGGIFVDNGSNGRNVNQNNIATGEKSTETVLTDNNEERIPFTGRTKKIKLNPVIHTPESRREDGNTFTREIAVRNQNKSGSLFQTFGHKQNNTFLNSKNRLENEDSKILLVPQNTNDPFANVRCAKLGDTSGEQDFGCTSEVSLTIHLKKDKNASKYILKEEQIKRTAYQESQQIQYFKDPARNNFRNEENSRENNEYENTSKIRMNGSYSIQFSDSAKKTQGLQTSRKKSSDIFELQTRNTTQTLEAQSRTRLKNETRNNSREHFVQPKPANSYEDYRIQADKIINNPDNRNLEYLILKREDVNNSLPTENKNIGTENETEQKNHNNDKTIPVHFYPQGVLLNIDLAHINEIPPQILLEVDYMLKKYMKEGDIDINLLEIKLNATKRNTTETETRNMETEEIMEMIKAIENVINTTSGIEMEEFSTDLSFRDVSDKTKNHTDANKDMKLDLNYENGTSFTEHTLRIDSNGSKEINTSTNNFKISEKIQNSEVSKHINADLINITTTLRPFGRRRLLRKLRYPSIRQQLERQNQYRNIQKVDDRNTLPAVTENTISEIEEISVSYPPTSNWMFPEHIRTNANPSIQERLERPSSFQDFRSINNRKTPSAALRGSTAGEIDTHVSFVYPSTKIWINSEHATTSADRNVREHLEKQNQFHDTRNTPLDVVTENTISEIDASLSFVYPSTKNWIQSEHTRLDATLNNGHSAISFNQERKSKEVSITGDSFRDYGSRIYTAKEYDTLKRISDNSNFSPTSAFTSEIKEKEHRTSENRNRDSDNHANVHTTVSDTSSNSKFENKIAFMNNHGHSNVDSRFLFSTDHLRSNYGTQRVNTISRQTDTYVKRQHDYKQANSPDSRSPTRSSFRTEHSKDFDTAVAQGRKKRKIRILVRKLINSGSGSDHEQALNHEKVTDIEQIPQTVLNNLKNKFLRKLPGDGTSKIELQIQFQDHVWNVPFVNGQIESDLSPAICTRAGLFQHPRDCTMFYECFWDKWLQRFTLHVFSCPVRLVYDDSVRGCSRPTSDSHCRPVK